MTIAAASSSEQETKVGAGHVRDGNPVGEDIRNRHCKRSFRHERCVLKLGFSMNVYISDAPYEVWPFPHHPVLA